MNATGDDDVNAPRGNRAGASPRDDDTEDHAPLRAITGPKSIRRDVAGRPEPEGPQGDGHRCNRRPKPAAVKPMERNPTKTNDETVRA